MLKQENEGGGAEPGRSQAQLEAPREASDATLACAPTGGCKSYTYGQQPGHPLPLPPGHPTPPATLKHLSGDVVHLEPI